MNIDKKDKIIGAALLLFVAAVSSLSMFWGNSKASLGGVTNLDSLTLTRDLIVGRNGLIRNDLTILGNCYGCSSATNTSQTFQDITVTSTATLNNVTWTNATGTNTTSSWLGFGTASGTNINALNAIFLTLFNNLLFSNSIFANNADVTNLTLQNTTSLWLGFTTASGSRLNTLDLMWRNATGTNTTSTWLGASSLKVNNQTTLNNVSSVQMDVANVLTAGQIVATSTGTGIFNDGDIKFYQLDVALSTTTYSVGIDPEGFFSVKRDGSQPGYFEPYTILTVDSPDVSNPVEATISDRVATSSAFHLWDIYNEFYPSETQVGLRLVSRGAGGTSTGAFARDIVIDRQIGTSASVKEPLIVMTSSTPSQIGFNVRYPTADFDFRGVTMQLKSAGTALFIMDRAATTNFNGFQFFTAGVEHFTIGGRNDSTNNLHLFNADTATSSIKILNANDIVSFATSTYYRNSPSGPIVHDRVTGACILIGVSSGSFATSSVACPTY